MERINLLFKIGGPEVPDMLRMFKSLAEYSVRAIVHSGLSSAGGRMTAALILGSLIFVCARLVVAQETYCPESISVNEKIEKVPDGWTARQNDLPSTLAGIGFSSGPPEDGAALVYDRWTKSNALAYAVWYFQPKSAHRIWLTCRGYPRGAGQTAAC